MNSSTKPEFAQHFDINLSSQAEDGRHGARGQAPGQTPGQGLFARLFSHLAGWLAAGMPSEPVAPGASTPESFGVWPDEMVHRWGMPPRFYGHRRW